MTKIEVNEDLVKKVAKTARLNLTESELKKFTPQLKEIIVNSFNLLDLIDTDESPSFQPINQKNKFRKDKINKSLSNEDALKNVLEKLKDDGYIKGPKVL